MLGSLGGWALGSACAHAALAARDHTQHRCAFRLAYARRAGPPVAGLPKGAKVEIEIVAEV